jgi:hypothetical protein
MAFQYESTLDDLIFHYKFLNRQLVYLNASTTMWETLAKMCLDNKKHVRIRKSDFFDTIKNTEPKNECYLCECAARFEDIDPQLGKCYVGCPMYGNFGGGSHCIDEDSCYQLWSNAGPGNQAKYADLMVDKHKESADKLRSEVEDVRRFISKYKDISYLEFEPIEFVPKRDVRAEFEEASRKAIDDAIALWQWIVQETLARGRRVEKSKYYSEHPEIPRPTCACPFCEVKDQFKDLLGDPLEQSNCERACPAWGYLWGNDEGRGCLGGSSAYSKWHCAGSHEYATSHMQASRFVTELLELKLQFGKK